MKTYLVTGAAGFIGSNFVRQLVDERPDAQVIAYDALTYAGNLENLEGYLDRIRFVRGDICDAEAVADVMADGVEVVVNFAAESHVDRSIHGAADFIRTNIQGTQVLLDQVRANRVARYVQISTDEVYGALGPTGRFSEKTPLSPNSPYSASKAGADLLAASYHHTFGTPVIITRCSNNYGPYQFPEKIIPLFITNLMESKKVPVYGDGMQIRDWIHVSDHARAIRSVIEKGQPGEVYNIGGDNEWPNIGLTRQLLKLLGQDESMIEHVKDRPGHDRRYAVDHAKITRGLGWQPEIPFQEGLAATVTWYRENESWWQRVKSGEYLEYYKKQYG
jgi:dTDP-glucose 4,6-dehydratase